MGTPFKMKGSPMQRNFGISPINQNAPKEGTLRAKVSNAVNAVTKHVANSYAGSIYKGVKNVVSKRGKGFDVRNNEGLITHGYSDGYRHAGIIPHSKDHANKIVERFKKGYNRRTN
jgi:hypothetical protein